MSSNERSRRLAPEQPVQDPGEHDSERRERIRQLANVLLNIFLTQKMGLLLGDG